MQERTNRLAEQVRPFLGSDEAYSRLRADVHDLAEICEWFLKVACENSARTLSRDELESLLIELDVRFVDHGLFHLQSLKTAINGALEKLADGPELERRGVA